MRSLKICSRSLFFIYHLDKPMEFTEILLPDTASRSWLAILIVSRGGSAKFAVILPSHLLIVVS
jgi:siroheme synthase (precorrin-2 oxidase/ferrochelatase)